MGGWQFGFEMLNDAGTAGAQAGSMSGAAGTSRKLARANAANQVGTGNAFTVNQATLLVMRLYKNNPADTVYNRADLYTDLDGADGLYNSEVTVWTGLDLSSASATNIARFRLHTDTTIHFDYVAVGTTKESVTAPTPTPAGGTVTPVIIKVNDSVGGIQWQASQDGSTWSDLTGQAGSTLDISSLYTNTPWFRVKTTSGAEVAYSTTLRVSTGGPQGTVIILH
jgi:hypothetical protein